MDPAGDDRAQDQRLAYYNLDNDNFADFGHVQDGNVGQGFAPQQQQQQPQQWPGHPHIAPREAHGWNNAVQAPQRQHTPNAAAQYDHGNFQFYGNTFNSGLPATRPISQSGYGWSGFNSPQFGNATIDPSLHGTAAPGSALPYAHSPYGASTSYQQTIAPAALQSSDVPQNVSHSNREVLPSTKQVHESSGREVSFTPATTFSVELPASVVDGSFYVIPETDLASVTTSKPLSQFLNLGIDSQEFLKVSKSSTVPSAPRRKSRNAIKDLAPNDPKLKAKLAKGKVKSKIVKSRAVHIPKPRLPLTKAGATVSTPSSAEYSSDDESDYDSSDDELDIIEEPPYPEKRPDEALKAVAYDVSKAVWLPRRKQPTPDQIRAGLKEFWEVLGTIRNRWKSDSEALKKAEEAKKKSEIPMLRERVKSQRDMVEGALDAALRHGHPEILRLMGEVGPFIQMAKLFMVDRVRDSDVNGVLLKQLLKLLVRCTTVTTETLEEKQLKKVLTVIAKKGDDEMKSLVKQFEEVAAATSKDKAEKAKAEAEKKEAAPKPKVEPSSAPRAAAPDSIAGIKRARPADGATAAPAKRVASTSVAAAKQSTGVQKTSPSAAAEKRATVSATPKAPLPGTAKAASLYAGLKSASKKPGTATSDKKAATPAAAATAAPKTAAPTFSFKDYMADLGKPKEPEKPKDKRVERAVETEEERRKRERKEARRGLRVQFKTGSALEDVLVFEHDPEEEMGHDASMVRDVGDLKSEGQMFKQHFEQMDMEIDEEAGANSHDEERLVDFQSPHPVDFEGIEKEHRLTSYDRFGGLKRPVSKERDRQDEHESNTLLAVYLNRADIPPNPREPSNPYDGDTSIEQKDFGSPPDQVLGRAARLSWANTQAKAPPAAWPPHGFGMQPAPPSLASGAAGGTPNLEKILASLAAHAPAGTQQPPPFPPAFGGAAPLPSQQQQPHGTAPPAGFENLFATFEKFKQSGNNDKVSQPAAAAQPAPASDLSSLLASIQRQGPAAPASNPVPPPIPPQMPPEMINFFAGAANMGAAAPTVDLNAIMAQFAKAGQPAPDGASLPSFGMAPPMQQQGSNNGFEHPDRKRMLETTDGDDQQDQGDSKKQRWDAGRKKGQWNRGEKPKFVLPCRFWKEGKCKRGAECTFLHE